MVFEDFLVLPVHHSCSRTTLYLICPSEDIIQTFWAAYTYLANFHFALMFSFHVPPSLEASNLCSLVLIVDIQTLTETGVRVTCRSRIERVGFFSHQTFCSWAEFAGAEQSVVIWNLMQDFSVSRTAILQRALEILAI